MSTPRPTPRRFAVAALACTLAALPLTSSTAHATPTPPPSTAHTATAASTAATLAATPPMGWNDWAHYQCSVDESTVVANANALVSSGLAAKGYKTVTVDDCWMASSRDSGGTLVANSTKFPHGMAWLGSYLHSKGLNFGIYEDAGSSTCGGYPGSGQPQGGGADHFAHDAATFASWGVDYLKLDGCNVYIPSGESTEQAYHNAYTAESTALANAGRPIVFSESAPAYFQSGEWGNPTWFDVLGWVGQLGQLWREGYDIATYNSGNPTASRWSSVMSNYGYNRWIARYAHPGNWNDPDFLIAGDPGLTAEESRSQVALWAMMNAPMILSSDVANLSADGLAALGNTDLIALDQDSAGRQAGVVSTNGTTDVLAKPLANGDRAVAVLNRGSASQNVSTTLASIGLPNCTASAKNLWTGTTTTSSTLTATIPAHGTAIWRLAPSAGCAAAVPTGEIVGNGAKCVDVTGSGTANGTAAILYTCTGNANQSWTRPGNSSIQTLGKCLTANGTTAGSTVVISACIGASAQQWTAQADGTVANGASGLCLDVYGGGSADGTKLDTWTCGSHQANQTWAMPS
ncbi:Ricin B lectin [Catenulispora acidiphila DSM 44928]|uniref:Alpha-galactosidase n=1 Tax=Catenulispora acidiphila (strain DSM 44928 / JCM 14897 / NBRC 102108 / NRRL B-24433 / ID139908) TaxID=479433 RepID=C7PY42_CATAD|nr:ricin-type beta-trefoil lectin domain protein [Catenulispora acidiphila]ACU73502.1 Ricin B lectin [Catenulispora acidiphila DSM 44928]